MKLIYVCFIGLFPFLTNGQAVKSFKQQKDKVDIILAGGTLSVSSMADNAVRVRFYKGTFIAQPELVFTSKVTIPNLKVTDLSSAIKVAVKDLVVTIDKQTGKLSFADKSGKMLLSEIAGSRKLIPGSVMSQPCVTAQQSFASPSDESLFGLGQFQDGQYNLKGVTRRLTQVNTQIAIPFIYSSKGYGLLWHQYGLTDFNPTNNPITLEKLDEQTKQGNKLAEVTTTAGTQKVAQSRSLYKGVFRVPEDGQYSIFLDLGAMGNRQYVVIDGTPCIDQTNMWLPPTAGALVKLTKGEHQVQLICKSDNRPQLSWELNDNTTTFRSPNAVDLDYVVFSGSADEVIASYRKLSGNVPMFPQWAYGFWQSRERYTSGKDLVEAVRGFRNRALPLDVIVQDWQYWGNMGWGTPVFDTINYRNPAGFIKEIHDLKAHFTVSIWSNPDKGSAIGKAFVAKDEFIAGTKWLDYFDPATRKDYWSVLNKNMFSKGVDSWWMDAVEPENDALKGEKTYIGVGDYYRLTYPLMVSQAVYEGQRAASWDKRVCILTRSAYLGQQKYGVINWSGDIGGTWDTYKRQIVAGLNFTITGFPYWTTDIGGFFRPGKTQYTDEKYQELLTRWFQWGVFCPIFRVHGYQSETEPWKYGKTVENNVRKMLNLRYNLLPYIYSEAWQVTHNGSTMMRPMVMDFVNDPKAVNQPYEYMFGKSFLVAPVTEAGKEKWSVYLPKSASWYDFWTGEKLSGGQTVQKETPLSIIPLYVKAGTILPIGPKVQYSTEKNWDNLEIRIYTGAKGQFTLYEDEGDNYNYEKGAYSTVSFKWDDRKKQLDIGDTKGSFAKMLTNRTFNIVLVDKSKGIGSGLAEKFDQAVSYRGKEVVVQL